MVHIELVDHLVQGPHCPIPQPGMELDRGLVGKGDQRMGTMDADRRQLCDQGLEKRFSLDRLLFP